MPRKLSHIAPDWWDYTTLDSSLINDAANFFIDFTSGLFTMTTSWSKVSASTRKERRTLAFSVIHSAQLARAVVHHH